MILSGWRILPWTWDQRESVSFWSSFFTYPSDVTSRSVTDKLSLDLLDRALIARLELDPQRMTWVRLRRLSCGLADCLASDDLEYLPVLVSLPPSQTAFEYLVGCWKRINAARSALIKKVRKHLLPQLLRYIWLRQLGIYSPWYKDCFRWSRQNQKLGN